MLQVKINNLARKLGYCSKPDFIIIGAQKAGTTALFSILSKHSKLIGSTVKEVHYFDNDKWFNEKKLHEYHSFFPFPHQVAPKCKLFEATPIYLYHPKVAERLFNYNKKLKLIVMLRNPALRALSAWTMYHHNFQKGVFSHINDPRSFKEAIAEDLKNIENDNYYSNRRGYLKRGIYHYQIETYLNYFSKEQLLILEDTDLKKDFDSTSEKIFNFIGILPEKLTIEFSNKSSVENKDQYTSEIELLKDFYKPHNIKLYSLLGKDYGWNK